MAERYAALAQAAGQAASPQLRNQGTVAGNLAQHVRCWYFRHPDLTCWLAGGDTCYAQIGDHRKHGLEAGDCISVAPSDLAAALLALDAQVRIRGAGGERSLPIAELYARPSEAHRSSVQLARGELITAVELPAPPDASAYERAGERAAWSFALTGIAAARFGDIAAAGRDRAHERAAPARPGRSAGRPARPGADRLEARARGRAVRARARARRVAIIAPVAAYDVAVIGAGTTGASIAYFLTQRGLRPVVFEKTRAAGGPSGASAGMCRPHYAEPAIIDMAKFGCEFLADMKARTGFQSGYSMSGYLVVGARARDRDPRRLRDDARARRGGRAVRRRPHPRARAAPRHATISRSAATSRRAATRSRSSSPTASCAPPSATARRSGSARA